MKQRKEYYSEIRKGNILSPKSAFEENYLLCFLFKKQYSDKTKQEKLEKLIELSKVILIGNKQDYSKRREKKHRSNKNCFVCLNKSHYQHHIILLKNGGYDNGINRIPLCNDCHKIIHQWLR